METGKNPDMSKQTFEKFDGHEVTDDMLKAATKLFNENYGIWGKDATRFSSFAKAGMLFSIKSEIAR